VISAGSYGFLRRLVILRLDVYENFVYQLSSIPARRVEELLSVALIVLPLSMTNTAHSLFDSVDGTSGPDGHVI